MASKIKVDQIAESTTSAGVTFQNDVTVPTGKTITIADGVPVASGGTGLASFTAGDVLYATGPTTLAKLAKGSASQALVMNAGATAPEWATASAGAVSLIASADVSSAVSTVSIDGHFSSSYRHYQLIIDNLKTSADSSSSSVHVRANQSGTAVTASNYYGSTLRIQTHFAGSGNTGEWISYDNGNNNWDHIQQVNGGGDTEEAFTMPIWIYDPLNTTHYKQLYSTNFRPVNSRAYGYTQIGWHWLEDTSAISGLTLYPDSGNLDLINWRLYGYE